MPTAPTLRQQLNRLIASSVPPLRALVKERDHLRHQSLFWRYTHTRLYWQNRALCRELYGAPQPTATPPREIPPELLDRYTLGGTVPVENNYIDATYPANWPLIYTDEEIDAYLATISQNLKSPPDQRDWFIYGTLDEWVCEALAKYPIQGKTVVNMGSLTPWYESICIHFGARPVTIDYNPITMRTDRIRFLSIADWEREPERFEVGLSISSFEHDGLGMYGDPLDPDGDIKAMQKMKERITPGGLLLLAVPTGQDKILFNNARIYGRLRLPLLMKGWEWIDSVGYKDSDLDGDGGAQPLYVLRNT